MKIKLLFIFCVCLAASAHAQVGVNTENPQGMLHVKGTTGTNNDVVVKETTGDVGIGTTNPTEKLHVVGDAKTTGNMTTGGNVNVTGDALVKGKSSVGSGTATNAPKLEILGTSTNSLRIEGNPNKTNYYLTSDTAGVSNWKYLRPDTVMYRGAINNNINISNTNYVTISQQNLTLTTGKWLVLAKAGIDLNSSISSNTTMYFLELCLKDNAGNVLCETGVLSESIAGVKAGTPSLTYILHIPSGTMVCSIGARAVTAPSNRNFRTNTSTNNITNPSYFIAIKLDDQ